MTGLERFAPPFGLQEAIRAGLASPTPDAFRATPFCRAHGTELDAWLTAVRSGTADSPGRTPLPGGRAGVASVDTLRIVHWNIQQGKAWDALAGVFDREPLLRDADIVTLNEVDIGTARTGNRNVVEDLAAKAGPHWAYVANYLELTKGPGADRDAPGGNAIGLHGLAILSRWPIEQCGSGDLIECFDYFLFNEEKRYGCRRVLWARIAHPAGPFFVATTHLEVRNTPSCRALQMQRAVHALPPGPGWLTGDWNTNTFRRRTLLDQAREFWRLQRTDPAVIDAELRDPYAREPLLALVEDAGFDLAPWNDGMPTARQVLSGVEELDRLPEALRGAVRSRFRLDGRILRMRLDWIASRGAWEPVPAGDASWTLQSAGPEGTAASDHAPIGCTARVTKR